MAIRKQKKQVILRLYKRQIAMALAVSIWLFALLPICAITVSQATTEINETDLHMALGDMRIGSYHGFVILLRMMDTNRSLQGSDMTFLMPADESLSLLPLSRRNLQEFILRHTIPTLLAMDDLLRFPNGTLIPTSMPEKMVRVAYTRISGLLYLNDAKIVNPNVCHSSFIRCHGINSPIAFDGPSHTRQGRIRARG